MKHCPRCGLVNPLDSQVCECGRVFADGRLPKYEKNRRYRGVRGWERRIISVMSRWLMRQRSPLSTAAWTIDAIRLVAGEGHGEPVAVFRPSPALVVTGYGTTVLLVFASVAVFFFALGRGAGWWWFFAALVGAALAVPVFRHAWRIHHCRVLLYPSSFIVVRPRGAQEFPWARVSEVREFVIHSHPQPSPEELTGEGVRYQVVRDDGEVFAFDHEVLDRNGSFLVFQNRVLWEAKARGIRQTIIHVGTD